MWVAVMRRSWGIEGGANRSPGRIGSIVVCVRKVEARSLVKGRGERTTARGEGKHTERDRSYGVSCSGSGEPGGRTELDLGSRKSLDDHHLSTTLWTAPERARVLGNG